MCLVCKACWPYSDIRSCCYQSVYAFTSRYDSILLGSTFLHRKVLLHKIHHTHTHTHTHMHACTHAHIHTHNDTYFKLCNYLFTNFHCVWLNRSLRLLLQLIVLSDQVYENYTNALLENL